MNRLWIGIGILVVMLAMGIGLLWWSSVFFEELSQELEQAGELALSGDWQAAGKKAMESEKKWEKWRKFWSSFTDHEPMEQMQSLFSQLELYRVKQMQVDFAAICRTLAHTAQAIEETHGLKWWSIL